MPVKGLRLPRGPSRPSPHLFRALVRDGGFDADSERVSTPQVPASTPPTGTSTSSPHARRSRRADRSPEGGRADRGTAGTCVSSAGQTGVATSSGRTCAREGEFLGSCAGGIMGAGRRAPGAGVNSAATPDLRRAQRGAKAHRCRANQSSLRAEMARSGTWGRMCEPAGGPRSLFSRISTLGWGATQRAPRPT